MTKTTGSYTISTISVLQSPIFDFTAVNARPTLTFWQNFNTEVGYDAGILKYRPTAERADKVYATLGTGGTLNTTLSTGWYNSSSTNGAVTPPKWSGTSTAYTGVALGWINSTTLLPAALQGQADVRFRWNFDSDVSTVDEGWAIDDVSITVPTITPTGTLSAVDTSYGTASATPTASA